MDQHSDINFKGGSKILIDGVEFMSLNGVIFPILNSDPLTPTVGQVYYNSVSNTWLGWNGSVWKDLTAVGATYVPPWQPPDLTLDAWLSNGASTLINGNAGFQKSFSGTANNQVLAQIPLDNEGIAYDGSNLRLRLSWQLFNTVPGATDTVIWVVNFVFVSESEDGDSKAATAQTNTIVVGGRTPNQIKVDNLAVMTGVAGAKFLGITLTRNSSGAGSDTYSGAADVFAIELIKV